jgi:hypothetical protein
LVPVAVGVNVSVVAKEAPPAEVPAHAPVVTAENAAADVPVAANVTVGGVVVHPPSFRIVVIFVAVEGLPTGAVGPVRLSTAI